MRPLQAPACILLWLGMSAGVPARTEAGASGRFIAKQELRDEIKNGRHVGGGTHGEPNASAFGIGPGFLDQSLDALRDPTGQRQGDGALPENDGDPDRSFLGRHQVQP